MDTKKKEYVRDRPYDWAITLVGARTEDGAADALNAAPNQIRNELKPLLPLILEVVRGRDFPKRRENQLDFLADSIAARGEVSPRRSRDIRANMRAMERKKSRHRILRKEFYVECSCGYKDLRWTMLAANVVPKFRTCPNCFLERNYGSRPSRPRM